MEEIFKNLKKVTLSPEEKASIRRQLITEIGPSQMSVWQWLTNARPWRLAFASLLIAVGTGSLISLAAEGSLPGSVLYPIKTKINEPVARLFQINSPSTKINFETRLVEKRLIEAETLSSKQELNHPLKDKVKKEVVKQATKAEDGVNGQLEQMLKKHQKIIKTLEIELKEKVKESSAENVTVSKKVDIIKPLPQKKYEKNYNSGHNDRSGNSRSAPLPVPSQRQSEY